MIDDKKVTAIVLVAGNSTRYGQNRNKNFEKLNGKAVLAYSLSVFAQNEWIDDILIAVKNEEIEVAKELVENEKLTKKVEFVVGGSSRKESVYHALKATNSEIVIIHDGARPMIKQEYVTKCLENMKDFKGVSVGVKSKDTIKITNEEGIVVQTTQRSNTWLVQTPQCFDRRILLKMHETYEKEDVTDDCMLLEKGNYPVKMIEGNYTNLKITTFEDLGIVQNLMEQEKGEV